MNTLQRIIKLAGVIFLGLTLFGCSIIGMVSDTDSFNGTESVNLPTGTTITLDKSVEIIRSYGYKLTSRDNRNNSAQFEKNSGGVSLLIMGAQSINSINLSIKGSVVNIDARLLGNFGTADQKAYNDLISGIKKKLIKSAK
jgi:hypothetical protein